jgi:hypothetical protein
MNLLKGQEVHPGTVWVWRTPTGYWPVPTCTFCGSIPSKYALKFLSQGNTASGSDWKNNWPHKFYVDGNGQRWKFYIEHITAEEAGIFESLTEEIKSILNITFEYDTTGRLYYRAPSKDYQALRINGVTSEISKKAESTSG